MENEKISETFTYTLEDRYELEDLQKRHLYITSGIDEETAHQIAYYILRWNLEDKDVAKKDRKPITIYISSPGGGVEDGFGIVDAIITSKTPVHTVNLGMCASMAFIIYISGHKKYSMPHAQFLMHDGSTFFVGSTAKAADQMKFYTEQFETMTKDFILEHTKITSETYDENYRKEWYFLPVEAKQHGVVEYIIGRDCKIDAIL